MTYETQVTDMDQIQHVYFDQRLQRLELILVGLDNAAIFLQREELGLDWWGTMDDKKELESIYKLAFMAIEHFIKSSIRDMLHEVTKLERFYEFEPHMELIVFLSTIHCNSLGEKLYSSILSSYDLDMDNYPLYNGLFILSKNRSLLDILPILVRWRQKIIEMIPPLNIE